MKPYDLFVNLNQQLVGNDIQHMDGFFAKKLGFDGNLYHFQRERIGNSIDLICNKLECSFENVTDYSFNWNNHVQHILPSGWYDDIIGEFYRRTDSYTYNGSSPNILDRNPQRLSVTWFQGHGWNSYEFTHCEDRQSYTSWYWLHVDDEQDMLEFKLLEN